MRGTDLYYKLPKGKRWMESGYEIGGRSLDVGQIAMSFETLIKNHYPPNAIPEDIVFALERLKVACNNAEQAIDDFIGSVSERIF